MVFVLDNKDDNNSVVDGDVGFSFITGSVDNGGALQWVC